MTCELCGKPIEEGYGYAAALVAGENWETNRKYYHLECMRDDRRRKESSESNGTAPESC